MYRVTEREGSPALRPRLLRVLHHTPHELFQVRHRGRRPLVPGERSAADGRQASRAERVADAVVQVRRRPGPVGCNHCRSAGCRVKPGGQAAGTVEDPP